MCKALNSLSYVIGIIHAREAVDRARQSLTAVAQELRASMQSRRAQGAGRSNARSRRLKTPYSPSLAEPHIKVKASVGSMA